MCPQNRSFGSNSATVGTVHCALPRIPTLGQGDLTGGMWDLGKLHLSNNTRANDISNGISSFYANGSLKYTIVH